MAIGAFCFMVANKPLGDIHHTPLNEDQNSYQIEEPLIKRKLLKGALFRNDRASKSLHRHRAPPATPAAPTAAAHSRLFAKIGRMEGRMVGVS